MSKIDNTEDLIDSRDVIERIGELELEAQGRYMDGYHPDGVSWSELADDHANYLDGEPADELRSLRKLAEQASGYAEDWQYGETLIRDSYFVTYAMEMADDIGAVSANADWPHSCIDWEKAARELRMDYTSVEFNGVTYWIR